MSTSEEYLKAFRENRVISLGKLWRSTPRDEIERLIKDVEGCQDCVLYWPLITGLKPGEYHIGWCNAAFPDQATAQRSQGRLDGFLIVARTIRASKAFSPIPHLDSDSTITPSNENRDLKRSATIEDSEDEGRKRARLSQRDEPRREETNREEDIAPAGIPKTSAQSFFQGLTNTNSVLVRKSSDQAKEWTEYYLCDPQPGTNYLLLVAKDDILDTIQIKTVSDPVTEENQPR
ncbi:hypothetical protein F4825DRAFT_471045 [Nemania diffusa]|nr:hypothetical protein F4825DRAFT_471045 [Nemania diffusa]